MMLQTILATTLQEISALRSKSSRKEAIRSTLSKTAETQKVCKSHKFPNQGRALCGAHHDFVACGIHLQLIKSA